MDILYKLLLLIFIDIWIISLILFIKLFLFLRNK